MLSKMLLLSSLLMLMGCERTRGNNWLEDVSAYQTPEPGRNEGNASEEGCPADRRLRGFC